MEAWVNISKSEAIQAVRRRAGEISSETIHVFDQRFANEWWEVGAIEQSIMNSLAAFWTPSGPHNHELVIVNNRRAETYLFVDVQRFAPSPLGTRRVEFMETREVGDYVGVRRTDRCRRIGGQSG